LDGWYYSLLALALRNDTEAPACAGALVGDENQEAIMSCANIHFLQSSLRASRSEEKQSRTVEADSGLLRRLRLLAMTMCVCKIGNPQTKKAPGFPDALSYRC
jgi:hypothetical protein